MRTYGVKGHPTHYTYRDDPAVLRALIRGAILGRRPVSLAWCEGDDALTETVQPTKIDSVAAVMTIRTESGRVTTVALWEVAAADVAEGESEAVA
jgi:hypothetical protein